MQLIYQQFDLPLRHAFTIAHGTVATQSTLIVQLSAEGKYGYGEATTNAYYGATIKNMSAVIEAARPLVESATIDNPLTLIESVRSRLPKQTFALSAIDQAIHDLWGKLRRGPVYQLWGLDLKNAPASNFTIGIDTPERMVQKLLEMPGWPSYKIKVGTADDLSTIRELRRHTAAPFRIDANCGWTAAQTIDLAPALKELGVEFIEQPLPPDDDDGALRVSQNSVLPIIADESCVKEDDVDRCSGRFHGINIKLVKCGGLAAARRMIDRARQLNLSIMGGCMTESTVGISALAQLLPLFDYVDMDGATLLAKDVASGVRVEHGRANYPADNGTGVRLLGGPLRLG